MSSSTGASHKRRTADCIRTVANFSHLRPAFLADRAEWNPQLFRLALPQSSPKLAALFEKIASLDERDLREDGTTYKHMIFTDLHNSTYGIRLLASAFFAHGYTPAFHRHGTGFAIDLDAGGDAADGRRFAALTGKKVLDRSQSVGFRKEVIAAFNDRTANTHGARLRFLILDQGFKEGIDLFDIRYIHLFEPLLVRADERQAIGRGTRYCGQKGLVFHPQYGWPLYVFRYEVGLPRPIQGSHTLGELGMRTMGMDFRRAVFAAEADLAAAAAAVDRDLTAPVHRFRTEAPPPVLGDHAGRAMSGGSFSPDPSAPPFAEGAFAFSGGARAVAAPAPAPPPRVMGYDYMRAYIRDRFWQFRYPSARMENLCDAPPEGGSPRILELTPTQEFVRHYFQPASAYKGLLAYHSVGTGKGCTAIATATSGWEQEGYTILWVTRHTLKGEVFKNLFDQVCSMTFREQVHQRRLRLGDIGPRHLSKGWMPPISYRQFSNMLLQKNSVYAKMLRRNGARDPLRRTLLIIDEAHRLYSPKTPASERPNTEILERMIQRSYTASGPDSVRVLLMTGTPIIDDGMELVRLLNLLRPKEEALPTDFEDFADEYLDGDGYFTRNGRRRFENRIAGYISYLDRSGDARTFAHPRIEDVIVPMTYAPSGNDQAAPDEPRLEAQLKARRAALRKGLAAARADAKGSVAIAREEAAQAKTQYEDCREANPKPRGKKAIAWQDPCEGDAAYLAAAKEALSNARAAAKEPPTADAALVAEIAALEARIRDLKAGRAAAIARRKGLKDEVAEAREQYQDLAAALAASRARARSIQDPALRKEAILAIRQGVAVHVKEAKAEYMALRARRDQAANEGRLARIEMGTATLGDLSQETALSKRCHVNTEAGN